MFQSVFTQITEAVLKLLDPFVQNPEVFTFIMKIMFPFLSIFILAGTIISLLTIPNQPEIWAKLVTVGTGKTRFLNHWENIIGRAKSSDIVIDHPSISRQHAAITRNDSGKWQIIDLASTHGVLVNDEEVVESADLNFGDIITLADYSVYFKPITNEEKKSVEKERKKVRPVPVWFSLILLTIFQLCCASSLLIHAGADSSYLIIPSFSLLTIIMWVYVVDLRILGIRGFELELLGFYLCTISLSVVGSYAPSSLMKQMISIILGIILLLSFGLFLRNLDRVQTFRWVMAGLTIALLMLSIIFGGKLNGAVNWINIRGVSLQPSEIAKICYIFAGAATLDRLFKKRNITLFIMLTLVCLAILAFCSDYGTAAIFFVTFIIIAYLRSGSIATIAFICSGAIFGAMLIITAKPYIFKRFSSWRHAWTNAAGGGYQQVNTMVAINHGGIGGEGLGNGLLSSKHVAAADTDLVFGLVCEEFGLIVGLLAIMCILTLALFAIRSCFTTRSTFYTIAACAATTLLLFQTALNVFGSVDILPLTGVTFPFISNGGSSMLASWGILAFLKATDTRDNASFATILKKREQAQTEESLLKNKRRVKR